MFRCPFFGHLAPKNLQLGQHVGGFKHHLNGYFVVFWGLFPGVTSQVWNGGNAGQTGEKVAGNLIWEKEGGDAASGTAGWSSCGG